MYRGVPYRSGIVKRGEDHRIIANSLPFESFKVLARDVHRPTAIVGIKLV